MTSTRAVVRVITRLNVGGPARHALLLSRHLADDYPTTLAAGYPTPEEGELTDPAVPVRRVPLIRPLHPVVDAQALRAVRRLLAEVRPAVLHTHMAKAGTVGRIAALTSRVRPRTVHTFHGHVLDGYFSAPVQRAFVEVERKLARQTDVLIAVSPQVRDALLGLGIGRPDQFRVIPLGLDLSSCLAVGGPTGVLRSRLNLPADAPLAGVISRLVPIKDHETLLRAINRLPAVHLAVIGDGELRPVLERRVRELGVSERVHFVGWWTDVAAALGDLDVVVLTSRNEGTPVSLIEAGAAARPVVATEVGGVAAVVQHGVTGYLARPGDPEHVASLVTAVLADRFTSKRMGEAARRHVQARFGQERLVTTMRELYDELCSRPLLRQESSGRHLFA